jgi:hypothetical protein
MYSIMIGNDLNCLIVPCRVNEKRDTGQSYLSGDGSNVI